MDPMTEAVQLLFLRLALAACGLFALTLWPLSQWWPAGFVWHETGARSYYFEMICAVYFVLGIFLLIAARNPLQHRSLIWFAIWSSAAHGVVMAVQSFDHPPHNLAHLLGDVPLLLGGAALLAWLMPRKAGR